MNAVVRFEPGEGREAGWQVFDAATGLLIEEGPWGPGGEITVTLPELEGDYRAFISSIDPAAGWGYERGERFVLVEAAVRGGRTELRQRETTLGALQWAELPRQFGRLLIEPWTLLWNNRHLIATMVRRDIGGRYRGSFAGMSWTVLNPLLLMVTYYFVFGVVLQTRFSRDPSRAGYVLYFLAGMLPWLAFSEALGRAPGVIVEHRNFVKKLVFPVEILPVNLTVAGLATSGLALIVYLFFLMATREALPARALFLPAYLLPQVLFTLGMAWLFSAIGVFLRDLVQINGFLLTLWFFLTPICYDRQQLPEGTREILDLNPIQKIVAGYRLMFLQNHRPDFVEVAQLTAFSLAVFYFGYGVFRKLRRAFPDVM